MIKWIDKRSVLSSGNKSFKAGDVIPAGLLSQSRIEDLKKQGKISVTGEIEKTVETVETVKRGRKPKQVETVIDDIPDGLDFETGEILEND